MNQMLMELWSEHSVARFPKGYGGTDVNGICVSSLDTYATGCISTYVGKNSGHLDVERFLILQKCQKELALILPDVDKKAYEYFNRLHQLCLLVIDEAVIQ